MRNDQKSIKWRLVGQGEGSSTANCHTKTPMIFRGISVTVRGTSSVLHIPVISRGIPNDVLRNPILKTLVET